MSARAVAVLIRASVVGIRPEISLVDRLMRGDRVTEVASDCPFQPHDGIGLDLGQLARIKALTETKRGRRTAAGFHPPPAARVGDTNCPSRRPDAHSSISFSKRRRRVSSRFAVVTDEITTFRYDGGCASKNAHAGALPWNSRAVPR